MAAAMVATTSAATAPITADSAWRDTSRADYSSPPRQSQTAHRLKHATLMPMSHLTISSPRVCSRSSPEDLRASWPRAEPHSARRRPPPPPHSPHTPPKIHPPRDTTSRLYLYTAHTRSQPFAHHHRHRTDRDTVVHPRCTMWHARDASHMSTPAPARTSPPTAHQPVARHSPYCVAPSPACVRASPSSSPNAATCDVTCHKCHMKKLCVPQHSDVIRRR